MACPCRSILSGWSGAERRPCGEATGDDRAVRWLDGTDATPLVLQFADDHHAFHEDAKRPHRTTVTVPSMSPWIVQT